MSSSLNPVDDTLTIEWPTFLPASILESEEDFSKSLLQSSFIYILYLEPKVKAVDGAILSVFVFVESESIKIGRLNGNLLTILMYF